MVNKIGGYKPSSGELEVLKFSSSNTLKNLAAINTLDAYVIPENNIPVDNQGQINSCVANASAMAFEILNSMSGIYKPLSRLFIYWNSRMYTGDTGRDDGTYIHNAMDSLTKLGVCEELVWPYDTAKVYAQPPISAYKEGNDNTINAFYQISSQGQDRINDIELAIRANHPVVFGTQIGSDFESYMGGGKVFNPPPSFLGGHALLLTGVRANDSGGREFKCKNSWGSAWGDSGYAWLSSDYMAWNQTNDLFVATKMDNLLV